MEGLLGDFEGARRRFVTAAVGVPEVRDTLGGKRRECQVQIQNEAHCHQTIQNQF